jgi:hypothetical protein
MQYIQLLEKYRALLAVQTLKLNTEMYRNLYTINIAALQPFRLQYCSYRKQLG